MNDESIKTTEATTTELSNLPTPTETKEPTPQNRKLLVQRPRFRTRTTEQGFDLNVELPGVAREDLKVAIEDQVLTVEGVREGANGERPAGQPLEERRYVLALDVHPDIDTAAIDARHEEGVLTLSLRKKAEKAKREIDILPN